jgi:hypothetical protein
MLFKIKTSFVLTVVLMLFSCALTPRLAAAQAAPGGDSSADNAAADKPAIDTAAIEEAAAKEAAAREAAKEAVARAEKRAALKAELEKTPLVVDGVVPYVELDEKGEIGNPQKLGKAGMGDRISVVISRLSRAVEYELVDPTKLVLFIDGRVFKDVYPESVGYDSVVYKLERTKEAIDAWNGLLGSPRLDSIKPVVVSVGYADQKPLGTAKGYEKANLNLIVYRKRWAVGCLIVLILMALVFWRYGGRDLLRDSGPPNPEPGKRPYSLAKVQVAWWFFLVVGCFLLIYLITGEFTMTEQALILIGIGTGTALGSAMIDVSKRNSSDGELDTLKPQKARLDTEITLLTGEIGELGTMIGALEKAIAANAAATDTDKSTLQTNKDLLKTKTVELAGKQQEVTTVDAKIDDARAGLTRPISLGPWNDLVTDANGPSFHRFQMIVWTVILGILFLAGVYKNLAMPEFSGTMLALMGISAGTYLGFKIPEKQNTADPSGTTQQPVVAGGPVQPVVAGGQVEPVVGAGQVKPVVADAQAQADADAQGQPGEDKAGKDDAAG